MKTNLLKSIFIALILVMGVANVWADVTFTEEAVIYFTMENDDSNWWNNSGCYHYATFKGASGTTDATVHLYNIDDRDNSASAQTNAVFFATISAGTYSKISFYRGTDAATLSSNYNAATEKVALRADKNKFGTIYNADFGDWQSWSKTQETSTVALSASSNNVNENDVVTLTPSLTTNADLNKIKSVSYSIAPNSGASIDGNEFKATAVGTYTVTATITYNAKGFVDITSTATATTTITVNPTETVYFINTCGWESAYAHCWGGNAAGTTWPGVKMNSTGEKIGGYDVYSYTANKGAYTSVKFNGGDYNYQTNDLSWTAGKYYLHTCKEVIAGWYTKEEAENILSTQPTPDPDPIDVHCVYFVNTSNWSPVYAYAWNEGGNQNANWPGKEMEKQNYQINGYNVYKYCTSTTYKNIIFTCGNSGCQTSNLIWEDGKYYNYAIKMHGDFTGEWRNTEAFVFSKDGQTATLTLNIDQVKPYNFGMRIGNDGDWTSNASIFTRDNYSHKIESGSGNCQFNADVTGEYTFTWKFASNTLTITYPTSSSYTVIFNKNANDATGTMANQLFNYDEAQALSPNGFTRNGYAFIGWSTASNGDVEYADEATVTNLDAAKIGTVTLYAQWLGSNPTYTINFDKQSGDGGTGSATVQYQNNNYNPLTVVAPIRPDYTFGGYYTQAEGAGVQVVSAAGEWLKSVTGYTDASGNWIKNSGVTLYAKWISNSTATEGLPTNVYLVGSFGRWDTKDEKQQFKKATADATIYTLAWTFDAAKTYEFKISVDGVIRGLDNNNEITVEKTSLVIPSTGNNCKITTTEAGEYIFTWDSKTSTLSVEYPSDRVIVTFFGDGGTVGAVADGRVLTSPAKVKPGTSVTFTATPDANNAFSQWKMNGAVVSTNLTYTCTIDADATIEAVFLKPTTVFLKPHSTWLSDNARFAIYYWNGEGDGWASMKQVSCHNEYYAADVPVGYTNLQFVRMNPSTPTNVWENVWNQTIDLTLPNDGKNLLDMTAQKMYLKPTDQWDFDGARFAAHFYNNQGGEWMSMFKGMDGTQWCNIPQKGYTNVMFGRMNGSIADNNSSDALWNKTNDLDISGGNCYEVTHLDDGYNDDSKISAGKWLWYGDWTKLELPTITITNTTPDFGDVVVKTTGGRIITNGEKVPFDTKLIVTMTPNNGYKLQTATIDGAPLSVGTQYPICDNTTINVTFEIKEEWYVVGVDGDWNTPQERFRFIDGQLEVELDTNITANFKIAYMQGTEILNRYGNQSFSITERDKILTLANGSGDHCNIATTYYGKYIFMWDAEQKKLTVTYPLSVGDYRLAYQDTQDNTLHVERVIKKCFTGDRLDTVSFFVRHNKEPKLVLQQCETLTNGVGTWKTINSNITFTVGKTGVWNFVLQQTNTSGHSVLVLTGEDDIKPYEGDYYIRTKSAKDGWTYFRSDSHKMTYSSYADTHEPFSHYFCKWVRADVNTKNVKYTIANDYGDCISDTLAADVIAPQIVTDANGDLPGSDGANVRFSWDWDNNELRRAYLAGSNDAPNDYLKLQDAIHLNGNANAQSVPFVDNQNWIYQLDVTATKNTKVNLTALYNGHTQYFKGGAVTDGQDKRIGLLSSDASDQITFNIRLVYDFKTNHLIVAWLPGNTQAEGALGANMMVIREHGYENGEGTVAVTQLNLTNNLTEVDTVYAVMTFDKEWIEKTPRTRDQSIYWVSFPFDVKVSDIFGFGEYADAWILQYYDGAERAEKGLFADSGTYWKYIMDANTTLKAGVGYVLVLDLNKVTFNHGVNSVSLYFPSCQGVNTISQNLSVDVLVPAHQCNIPYGTIDHTITDSHWNLIGVPAFKDITVTDVNTTFNQVEANFYYEFKFSNNGYDVKSAATDFKSMYGYMVQYAGTIKWSAQSSIPEQIAARRNGESELPEKVVLGLELVQGEEKADQTFVQLQQEGATTDFDMNLDLTKIINSGANIYTLTNDRIQAAGNALPMEESVVPVGVQIAAEGEYTFRMPDGTEGMVVELIDYETNTRTNLLLSDYIVTLPKGTSENRFALHIQPQKDVVTSLENIGEGVNNGEAVNKYLIDGKLIIRTAEGVVYDAQGKRL